MATQTKPHRTRASELEPAWHVLDAEGKTLGRLSSEVAVLLQGKHKPTYVPYLNTGDFVIVINAEKIRVTGSKLDQKVYYRHSGYHGGLKEETLSHLLDRAPTRALKHAVKGMLPKNIMGRRMLSRLKLYAGDSHPHAAQVNARPKLQDVNGPPTARVSPPASPAVSEGEEAKPRRTRRTQPTSATQDAQETAPAAEASEAEVAAPEADEAKPRRTRRAQPKAATQDAQATASKAEAPEAEVAVPEADEAKPRRRRRTQTKAATQDPQEA